MTRGNFITCEERVGKGQPHAFTSYQIRLKVDSTFKEPRIVKDGSISFSGWGSAEDRDLYLSLWSDADLAEVERLTYALYASSDLKTRKQISGKIEYLKSGTQKRGSKQLRDS